MRQNKYSTFSNFKRTCFHHFGFLGLKLLGVLNRTLPFGFQMKMGRALGRLLYYLLSRRRRIAEINLKACLKITDPLALKALLFQNFRSFGQGLMETGFAWFADTQPLRPKVRFLGREHIEAALGKGQGLILIGTHVHALDLFGRLFAQECPLIPTYRRMKNPLVNAWMERARLAYFPAVIERRQTRAMVRALKNNQILWLAPDQDYGPKHSVFTPFFGVQAATITSIVQLARLTKAKVAMIETQRLNVLGSEGYELKILPAFENYPSDDLVSDVACINQAVENLVKQDPSQYLWQHRRFKTRPAGEPYFYE